MSPNPPIPPPIQRRMQQLGPLSYSQESLWFLQQLDPDNNAYNQRSLIRFHGGMDPSILEKALNELVKRHEPLRTVYPNRQGYPVQVVQPFHSFSLDVLDYSNLAANERFQAIRRYASEHGDYLYDLQRGPLVRFALLHDSPGEDYLFFGTHHISSDAWSRQIVFNEIIQLYAAFHSGKTQALHELPIQYVDYALWQREWLNGGRLAEYINHWTDILSGELPTFDLPADHPRPAIQTFHGARYYFSIQPAMLKRVKEFSQNERLTPFHIFLTAFSVMLMRYTGQEDIILGCPFANRSRPELDGLVGLFVNTLPIRVDLSGNPGVRELMNKVSAVMLDAFAWQAAPFEALVSEISPERNLSRTPVFQVTITQRNVPEPHSIFQGLEIENIFSEETPAPFDLSLEFDNQGDKLSASFLYNVDLFDETSIIHMAAHYQNILGDLLQKTDLQVAEINMLTPSEEKRIINGPNGTTVEYPADHCLHELIESQADKTPNAPAVRFNGQILSYQDLNRRANQLARTLRGLGVGAETLVALYVERSIEMIIGLLAILKAGGAYVPIDPDYPLERRAFILKDCAAPVILTLGQLVHELPDCDAQVICIDSDEAIFTVQSDENLANLTRPENLAYVIYTSGSTGDPNGVMVTHHNVVRLFQATQPMYQFNQNDVWTMFHSYAFDFSVWEIWGALIHGGCLVVVPYLISRSPETFYRLVENEGVTVLNQTPSAFHQFIQADGTMGISSHLKLRYIIFGGEVLDVQTLRPWLERHGDLKPQLINMYGITEATVHVTYCPVHASDLNLKTGSFIGHPISDLQIYLLDAHQHPCPAGVTGEIYVGGAGVARGYLNRTVLTAERFIGDPFHPGKHLYKSGDLARRHANGDLEYSGRADFQIKLRGFRIEPGEIESVLEKHPGVQQAVVVMREERPGDKRLVSYILPTTGAALGQEQLRGYLKEKIPAYMVPSAFVFLESFPITVNGKIDTHALPPVETRSAEEHFLGPRNDIEERLVSIWKEVLEVEQVGVRDNFFELGGHSLLAVHLFAKIQDEFGQSLPLLILFKEGTVEALAAALTNTKGSSTQNGVIPIQPEGNEVPFFFLSPGLYMRNLAFALGNTHPVYGLHPYENGKPVYHGSIQETAWIYYQCLIGFNPQGPYLLLGHSQHGYYALELARLLRKEGKKVGFLGLVDTYPPGYRPQANPKDRAKIHQDNLRGKNLFEILKYLALSARRFSRRWWYAAVGVRIIERYERKGKINDVRNLLLRTYKPESYDGQVTIFSATQYPSYLRRDPMEQWANILTGPCEFVPIRGNHMSILEAPQVNQLAESILDNLHNNEAG